MSGLHNKFPAYMYKRGNLFGKALSADLIPTAAEQDEARARVGKPKTKRPTTKRNPPAKAGARTRPAATVAVPVATPQLNANELHARLWQFLTTNLTGAEMGRWEHFVAARQSDSAVMRRRGWLLVASLPEEDAARSV
ncbi:MAG TPA: hypothetical protein VFW14_19245 [Gaiellales bacterium]|jgi:hypothetical protein|nr:hypothetical protein [Gaiellales bacterium]